MPKEPLPHFVIIGAAKSATTWLAINLQRHRQVFMPDPEIHYFSRHHHKGMPWYLAHFAGARAGQVAGERSNTYFTSPEAPRRLKLRLPHARLIVQLRNPIERAYSDYCMLLRRGEVDADIDRYLDIARTPLPHLLDTGLYGRNLARFLDEFPAAQIKVALHDDVADKPASVLQEVCAHIGVDAAGLGHGLAERVYDRATPEIVNPRIRKILPPLRRIGAPYRNQAWLRALRSTLGSLPSYPAISQPTLERLRDFYRADIDDLSALLGRELLGWLGPDADR